MASASSGQNQLQPSAGRQSTSSPQKPAPSSSSTSVPRAPLSAHPTAVISELAHYHGTHPITIGAGTVIHPRTRLLSFEGPISIGEGCIIGEKAVIGGPSTGTNTSNTTREQVPADNTESEANSTPTILENSIQIGPLATISAGAHVRSATVIDTSATIGRHARIGKHVKVCSSCCIPENDAVDDWIVVWGRGAENNCRRKRPRDRGPEATAGLGGRDVESARLTVLNREREGLTKLIGTAAGTRRK